MLSLIIPYRYLVLKDTILEKTYCQAYYILLTITLKYFFWIGQLMCCNFRLLRLLK